MLAPGPRVYRELEILPLERYVQMGVRVGSNGYGDCETHRARESIHTRHRQSDPEVTRRANDRKLGTSFQYLDEVS